MKPTTPEPSTTDDWLAQTFWTIGMMLLFMLIPTLIVAIVSR